MKQGTVWFIGAGPGDPELLTVKGRRLIEEADLVLYAGSLVPRAVVSLAKKDARVVDSAPLSLEESHALVCEAVARGENVARVHTGDPSLYAAMREQMELLRREGIRCLVVPGVTAACAAAARAGVSFTVPGVAQSLILTRLAGRTPVPERERVRRLAEHHCPLAVYLAAGRERELQEELSALPGETPVICAHRIGWPEERLVRTTVARLAVTAEEENFSHQTVFLILPGQDAENARSLLYDPSFSHSRRASGPS
jgi:precorrin-4/cobalt-precorrin-4 C11-methyltransferase